MKPIIDLGLIQLPTFYVILCLALLISLTFLSNRLEKNKNFERKMAFDLALVLMIFGFIGGRLFHVIYEEPHYYFMFPDQIFQFWKGGFVYFGGFISAVTASYFFLKSRNEEFLRWADFMAPVASLMYALGRWACFFEGCCFGKSCSLPWAIHGLHPTQLYMVLAEFFVLIFMTQIKSKKIGQIFFIWLTFHSFFRLIIEFYRNDDRGFMFGNIFSISQLISLIIGVMSLYFLKKIQSKS